MTDQGPENVIQSTLDAALERLSALHPKRIDLSLDRMMSICQKLGDPQMRLPKTIHVAGTNGKGSTIAFLRAILEADNKRVHVYSSPHLVRFCERIRLSGDLINDTHLTRILDDIETQNNGEPLTFFEATTAAAFVAFSETPADFLLLETGLGGRLDATNIINDPYISIITPIDYDHQDFLGTDLAAIAREKAGIIKPNTQVICAAQHDLAFREIDRSAIINKATVALEGRDFSASLEDDRLVYQDETSLMDYDLPRLYGAHQCQNASLAIRAARALGISQIAINKGLRTAFWPARMQNITKGPLIEAVNTRSEVWVDGAHNPHAARALFDALQSLNSKAPLELVMVIGQLKTKDAKAFFEILKPLAPKIYTVSIDNPNAYSAHELADIAQGVGLNTVCANLPIDALRKTVDNPCRVVIAGSLYLAAEVLGMSPLTYPD